MHPTARRLLPILAIAPTAAAGILLSAPAADAAKPPRPVVHDAADTSKEQRAVKEFWTASKMAAAKPLVLVRARGGRTTAAPSVRGTAKTVKPAAPDARAVRRAAAPAEPGAPASPAPPAASPSASAAPEAAPPAPDGDARVTAGRSSGAPWAAGGAIVRTEGRIFFTYQGRSASCSGTAVNSANKSVVITAGHCVKLGGAFHTNWVFVPGYDAGQRPYGTWVATSLLTTPQWDSAEDMNHDMAAAVIAPLNGQKLVDVVGGQGVAFNQARALRMYAFGYPAASPYNGSKLIYCSGRAFEDYLISTSQGLTCNMTGGSSGGGWFLNFSESTGTGTLNSVNSFKYNFAPYWMFGPYFGAEAQAVYTTAQNEGLT
ncbi:peptidase [Sphaerisporangium sp. TRM90804]|uniref:trypsin-like serine peptidase n=1 Tax=Sphaerisporangium sp. TRM90804 TaxID=3031113 RepID=UPI0024494911|nr:peptidase [Sphaerisporangium sp. TRM90804]MDH2425248.1 peptidase [Sphaerisporangium sp. TRM90804]